MKSGLGRTLIGLITGEPYSSSIEKRQLHWSLNNGYPLFIEMDDNVDEECHYHIPRKYDVTVDENIHLLKAGVPVDNLSAVSEFQAGEMAYDPKKKEMVIFKSDHKSDHPLMHLGVISEFDESVADLLEKLQDGQYQLY